MSFGRLLAYCLFLVVAITGLPKESIAQKEKNQEVKTSSVEGTVEVSFRIDPQGKIEILSMSATSPQLSEYVVAKLKKVQLEKGDPQIGQVIKYRFVFKKQT